MAASVERNDARSRSLHTLGAVQLLDRAISLADRVAMIHGAGEIGICKRDATVWPIAQDVARRRLAAQTEEEAGLRIHGLAASLGPRFGLPEVRDILPQARRYHIERRQSPAKGNRLPRTRSDGELTPQRLPRFLGFEDCLVV